MMVEQSLEMDLYRTARRRIDREVDGEIGRIEERIAFYPSSHLPEVRMFGELVLALRSIAALYEQLGELIEQTGSVTDAADAARSWDVAESELAQAREEIASERYTAYAIARRLRLALRSVRAAFAYAGDPAC